MNTMIIISDIHAGCKLALCPPNGVKLDEGGKYMPSSTQRKIWAYWRDFWDRWVPDVTHGDPYCLLINGDGVDGSHHNSTTQITQNITTQGKIAYEMLAPEAEKAKQLYITRGTGVHDGESGREMESLAEKLGAIPNKEGQFARYELWKYLGGKKALIHALHHIGTTGSAAYESTAVHKEMIESFVEAGRWGERAPDVIVRAHRHRYFKTEIATKNDRAMSIVTPCWQGKTPFVFKIGLRQSQPQFGGIMLKVSDDGELYERHYVKGLERPKPEK